MQKKTIQFTMFVLIVLAMVMSACTPAAPTAAPAAEEPAAAAPTAEETVAEEPAAEAPAEAVVTEEGGKKILRVAYTREIDVLNAFTSQNLCDIEFTMVEGLILTNDQNTYILFWPKRSPLSKMAGLWITAMAPMT